MPRVETSRWKQMHLCGIRFAWSSHQDSLSLLTRTGGNAPIQSTSRSAAFYPQWLHRTDRNVAAGSCAQLGGQAWNQAMKPYSNLRDTHRALGAWRRNAAFTQAGGQQAVQKSQHNQPGPC